MVCGGRHKIITCKEVMSCVDTRRSTCSTAYGLSNKGWITTELFKSCLEDHFLEHAVAAHPLLLLLNGHSTHFQRRLLEVLEKGSKISIGGIN